jgi:hypothetical protein
MIKCFQLGIGVSVLVDVGCGQHEEGRKSKELPENSASLTRNLRENSRARVSAVIAESAEESAVYAPAAILIANSRHIFSKIRHVSDIVSNFRDHCRRLDLFLINF